MKYRSSRAIGSILSPDASPMSFNEAPADSQAQANSVAASFVAALYLIEAIEDALGEVWRNAWPIIGYMQSKLPCLAPCFTRRSWDSSSA